MYKWALASVLWTLVTTRLPVDCHEQQRDSAVNTTAPGSRLRPGCTRWGVTLMTGNTGRPPNTDTTPSAALHQCCNPNGTQDMGGAVHGSAHAVKHTLQNLASQDCTFTMLPVRQEQHSSRAYKEWLRVQPTYTVQCTECLQPAFSASLSAEAPRLRAQGSTRLQEEWSSYITIRQAATQMEWGRAR